MIFVLSFFFILSSFCLLYINRVLDSINYEEPTISAASKRRYGRVKSKTQPKIVLEQNKNNKSYKNSNGLWQDPNILNILVLGIDSDKIDEAGRSDSSVIFSIDSKNSKIKITSVMRDILVEIPGYFKDKLGHAYAHGGTALALQTFEKNFGVKIDKYVQLNFEGFMEALNALGGIDINLTADECEYINEFSGSAQELEVSDASKHLNPEQILCHSRNRNSPGSDFDRTARQREIIKIILEKLRHTKILNVINIVSSAGSKVTTNLGKKEIMKLVTSLPKFLNFNIEEYRIPQNDEYKFGTTEEGMSVLIINDFETMRSNFANFLFETY